MSRLFVRERQNAGRGTGRPRFALVAVEGADLKVYHTHIRKSELEKIAEIIGAEIVYLPRGEQSGGEAASGGHRRRRGRNADQE